MRECYRRQRAFTGGVEKLLVVLSQPHGTCVGPAINDGRLVRGGRVLLGSGEPLCAQLAAGRLSACVVGGLDEAFIPAKSERESRVPVGAAQDRKRVYSSALTFELA